MRLFRGSFLASSLLLVDAQNQCDLSELSVPENAEGWDCDPDIIANAAINDGPFAPPKTKCWLQCKPGYIDYICE